MGQQAAAQPGLVYPDPATDVIYLSNPPGANYTSASILSSMGQPVETVNLLANSPVVRVDLPRTLPTGIYFIRFSGAGVPSLTARVLKTP